MTEQPTGADVTRLAEVIRDAYYSRYGKWKDQAEIHAAMARAVLDTLAAAGRLLPEGTSPDVILTDGTHRYWSTHCRHGSHEACKGTCKTCRSPCVCPACGHASRGA